MAQIASVTNVELVDGRFTFYTLDANNNVLKVYSGVNKTQQTQSRQRVMEDNGLTDTTSAVTTIDRTAPIIALEKFDINQRFKFVENAVKMVGRMVQPSAIIIGSGGLGKSYTVTSALKSLGLIDITDAASFEEGSIPSYNRFKIIKGYSTAKALYRTLYENKDSIVIFDDCDSIMKFPDAANILKGALDTTKDRIICWNAETRDSDDLPKSFKFTGGCIFISNLEREKIPQAMQTRSLLIDVTMTKTEIIQRMAAIVESSDFEPSIDYNIKLAALKLVDEFKDHTKELSLRTLIQVARIGTIHTGEEFRNFSRYVMTN